MASKPASLCLYALTEMYIANQKHRPQSLGRQTELGSEPVHCSVEILSTPHQYLQLLLLVMMMMASDASPMASQWGETLASDKYRTLWAAARPPSTANPSQHASLQHQQRRWITDPVLSRSWSSIHHDNQCACCMTPDARQPVINETTVCRLRSGFSTAN